MISQKVIDFTSKLLEEGYNGEVVIKQVNSTYTGSREQFEKYDVDFVVQLSGFCKEDLYLFEHNNQIVGVGRYRVEFIIPVEEITVKNIVDLAYSMFKCYQNRGYGEPAEFKKLFVKYGHVTEEIQTKVVRKYN
jgi:hypothetical protein